MDEREYWVGFSVFPGIGPLKFKALLQRFGTAKDAWSARKGDLQKIIGEVLSNKFDRFRSEFSIKLYLSKLKEKRVSFVLTADKEYPKLLAQIKNPPFVLYIKGEGALLGNDPAKRGVPSLRQNQSPASATPRTIAVVGTRRITNYGREVTEMFVHELVDAGFTIVSGLALGVDAVAHKSALEARGKTIAVLGCGVDCCTPAENQALYNSIVSGRGCVISELPLGHPPTKGSFPSRNRIIAGLSLGVLVTEGAEDSGSLITADYAFKFNRKVFAVPGPITSGLSKGPYKLIKKGAKLVTTGEDILYEFKSQNSPLRPAQRDFAGQAKLRNVTKEEDKILKILENEAMNFDEIVRHSGFDSGKIGSILSVMEIRGLIKSTDGGMFGIIRET